MRKFFAALVVAASALPASAGPAAPLVEGPDVPPVTQPAHVLSILDNARFDSCAGIGRRSVSVAVPAGAPDRAILGFTGVPDGDPWDRLFSVSIAGVEVLRGTSPRAAFTIRRDITEYLALLTPGATAAVTVEFGTWVPGQRVTTWIELYENEPTAALVRAPRARAIGLVERVSMTEPGPTGALQRTHDFGATPPARATVDFTTSNHGDEEAFFLRRTFHVAIDGVEVATVYAMPYTYAILGFGAANANDACTGPATSSTGNTLHPLMWWTAQQGLDAAGVHLGIGEIPPYRAEIAPEHLGLLTGQRSVTVRMEVGGSYWVTSLSLLLD